MAKDINFNMPAVYRIQVREDLGSDWNEWFGDLRVTQAGDGGSLLTGLVADQAALQGLIRKVRDLGLTLVSVQRMEAQSERGETV